MTDAEEGTARRLEMLRLAMRLKETPRAGWALRDVAPAESVADHTFGVTLLAWLLAPEAGVDRARCVELALAHDLAEALVGDITPYDGVPPEEKRRRESDAIARLAALAGADDLAARWAEYDAAATPEARFVKSLDKLETALQADAYERREGRPGALAEFRAAAVARAESPVVRALLAALGEPGA